MAFGFVSYIQILISLTPIQQPNISVIEAFFDKPFAPNAQQQNRVVKQYICKLLLKAFEPKCLM